MSRTDKDRPPWVRAKDEPSPTEWHYWMCETKFPRWGLARVQPCDIDQRHKGRCQYFERDRAWHSAPPNWFRLHRWYEPERNSVRMDCGRAVKEYRGVSEVDVLPSIEQHRHGASWDWM